MKRRIRRAVVHALGASGVLAMLRRHPDRSRAVILRYHSVSDWTDENAVYRDPAIAVSPALFDRQMAFLATHYRVVPLSELVECVADKRPFPERAVAITFDDGYRDNFVHALPSLRRNGLPALVYVTTDGIGNGWGFWLARMRAILSSTTVTQLNVPGLGTLDLARPESRTRAMSSLMLHFKNLPLDDASAMLDAVGHECDMEGPVAGAESWMMSWEELRAMTHSGVEIGAHTCRHPILTRQSMAVARDEIERSHKVLQEGLGVAPMHFAYPNGSGVINHDDRTARLVEDAGFASASTSINGPLRRDAERYRLHRVGVSRHSAFDGFVFNLERDRFTPRRSVVVGGKQNR